MYTLREWVEKHIDALMDNYKYDCNTNRAVACDLIMQAVNQDRECMAAALMGYLVHKPWCRATLGDPCTCGLNVALATAKLIQGGGT